MDLNHYLSTTIWYIYSKSTLSCYRYFPTYHRCCVWHHHHHHHTCVRDSNKSNSSHGHKWQLNCWVGPNSDTYPKINTKDVDKDPDHPWWCWRAAQTVTEKLCKTNRNTPRQLLLVTSQLTKTCRDDWLSYTRTWTTAAAANSWKKLSL